jgi:hypothetical protein
MASVSGGGNYMSDGAIMEWLATQQDRLYGDLRDSMRTSEARAAFADELTEIKAGLHRANQTHDFKQVDEQMQQFLETYGSDPAFAETCEGLKEMFGRIHDDTEGRLGKERAAELLKPDGGGDEPVAVGEANAKRYQGYQFALSLSSQGYTDGELQDWDKLIDGKLDVAGKNDQMNMIHIQQLKATIDQGSQFGSQYIASGDKTSSSIINNIA